LHTYEDGVKTESCFELCLRVDLTSLVVGWYASEEDSGPTSHWGQHSAYERVEEVLANLLDAGVWDVSTEDIDKAVGVGRPTAEY
jgi:hypothetical protein